MGRLKTWIDRIRSAAPRRRRDACVAQRRRLLAFEQFESRIVMSAAVQATSAAGDNTPTNGTLTNGALLQELWTVTPGSAQWGDVSFALTRNDDSPFVPVRIDRDAAVTNSIADSVHVGDGGLIEISPMIAGNLSADFSLNVSPWLLKSAFHFQAFAGNSRATVGAAMPAGFVDHAGLNFHGLSNTVDVILPGDLGGIDAPADLFGDANLGAASEPATDVTASPMLRITSPLSIGDSEGGAIDLTAIVAPKAVLAAEVASRLATGAGIRSGDSLRLTSTTTREALSGAESVEEGLRVRAVVLEVALAKDAGSDAKEATQADRVRATPNGTATPAAPTRHTDRDTTQAAPVRAGAIAIDAETGDGPAESAPTDRVSTSEGTPASGGGVWDRAAAHDAAFGELDGLAESHLAVDADVPVTRQQTVGLALALVAGATPLIKRARRARSARLPEPSSDLL